MKAHRNILILSFFAGIISLIFIIILPQSTKSFQIALAFIGSSFISFLLELPSFVSLRKNNFSNLYYSMYDLKMFAFIIITSVDNSLNQIIATDKFCEQIIQKIIISSNNLRGFDRDYYFFKKSNNIISDYINSIYNASHNIYLCSLKYTVSYKNKELNKIKSRKQSISIMPNEMINELILIKDNAQCLISIIDKQAELIFSKKDYKHWINDDSNLVNDNNNNKIMQK